MPGDVTDMIYHLTFTVHQVQKAMKYVLLVLSIVLPCWLLRRLLRHCAAEGFPDVDVVTPK
jgi:hypothetical protein